MRPKRRGGNNPRRVDLEWLEGHARKEPDARIVERIAAWEAVSGRRVSVGAMWNALRAVGWTHKKKTPVARERDRADVRKKREAFVELQKRLDPKRLCFLDESGFRLGSPPHYGWAPRGEKSAGKSTQGAWTTMTMIGAIGLRGFSGFMTIDAATDAAVFRAFARHELVPQLRPGDIVVMDNLSAHKDGDVLRAVREAGADVLYLPPYSPEYNPIEKAWAKIKEILRRLDTLTRESFDAAVATAMEAVTLDDIAAWVKHAGYQASPA